MSYDQENGRGTCVYDSSYDTLTFRTGLWYHHSVEIENFAIDFDEHESVSGLRVFDASQTLDVDRTFLSTLSGYDFNAQLEDGMVQIRLSLVGKDGQRFTHHVKMPLGVHHISSD